MAARCSWPAASQVLLLVLAAASSPVRSQKNPSAPSPSFAATPESLDALLPAAALEGEQDDDAYVCTSVLLPTDTLQLTAFEALAPSDAVTSMMLYGCKTPAEDAPTWSCYMRSPCGAGREAILTGWSRDAPPVALPAGVSFSVGAGTGVATIVLQVHYGKGRPRGDRPGFRLSLSPKPTPYTAGMLTFASKFTIPAGEPSHRVGSSCCYAGVEPLHALAFRVHTHGLGRSVWMERKTADGHSRIAEGDPRRAQGFAPAAKDVKLLPGDVVTATCDFDSSSRKEETAAGADSSQEMCNLFMMVWSENPYFMVCGNDRAYVRPEGPGGIPEGAMLSREGTGLWQPPQPLGRSQNDGSVVGQIAGVSKGPDDTIWVLHRGAKPWDAATFFAGGRAEHITDATPIRGPTLLQLRQETGEVLRSWGDGKLVMPHGLAVDQRDGSVWVADAGRHQVLKFDADGEQLLALGIRQKPGHDTAHFCKPTSVTVSNTGDVFVADGYCNARVLHFTPTGKFVQIITLPQGKLQTPHSVAVDSCANALYVADRDASAVRRFNIAGDFAGELSRSWDLSGWGPVYAVTPAPYGALLALTWDKGSKSAAILHLDTAEGDDTEGSGVLDSWELSNVRSPHDIALSAAPVAATLGGSRSLAVYVAETAKGRPSHLHKFIIHSPGVSVVEAPHEQLAEFLGLPELETEAGRGSALAGGTDAASEIERAAAQVERAAAELQRLAAKKELSDAQREAAAQAAGAASAALDSYSSGDRDSLPARGHGAVAGASGAKAAGGRAAATVSKALGLRATKRSQGPGHYLMVVLAPIGALAVFAALALALTQKMGAWPNSTSGFAPLPTWDDFLTASPNGSPDGSARSDEKHDPTEVVVSSQVDLSKSVRRTSRSTSAGADMRRIAQMAAQVTNDRPLNRESSPLGGDPSSLRNNSMKSEGSLRTKSSEEAEKPPPARPRPSVRRASASTAQMSADSMRRCPHAHRPQQLPQQEYQQQPPDQVYQQQTEEAASPFRHMRSNSGGNDTDAGSGGVGGMPTVSPPQAPGVQRLSSSSVQRASWSGSLSSISELMGGVNIRELAAGVDTGANFGRRGLNEAGVSTSRRMKNTPPAKTDSQQD